MLHPRLFFPCLRCGLCKPSFRCAPFRLLFVNLWYNEANSSDRKETMSEQTIPLTYEGILELFRETREQMKETDRKFQMQMQEVAEQRKETDRRFDQMRQETERRFREAAEQRKETDQRRQEIDEQMKKTEQQMERTHKEISALGSRVGEIVENMVGGDIVEQFQALGYKVTEHSRRKRFGVKGAISTGEIDLLLEDGDVVILIEVKTTLKVDGINEHIERLEKYRHYIDSKGSSDKRKLVGAIAAASASDEVIKYAHKCGLYVIVQAGRTVEILPQPEGFVAKKW